MAVSFKGAHFPKEIILMGVRWYVAYPLSTRHVEELMEERAVEVDHSTINRWVIKYSPQLEEAFHRHKRPGYCRKVRFLGKIPNFGLGNSMTSRLPNSRKSNFATQPEKEPRIQTIAIAFA